MVNMSFFIYTIGWFTFHHTYSVTCVEGTVQLQNPDALSESQLPSYDLIKDQVSRGIVEVCINQSYSTILMDSFWSDEDASVICKQLGFSPYGELLEHSLVYLQNHSLALCLLSGGCFLNLSCNERRCHFMHYT